MQRHRNIFEIFPENFDLNQGPNFNSRGMNESDEYDNMSATERHLLSNDLSNELNFSHDSRSFSSWDVGESSSRANVQDQVSNGGSQVAFGPLTTQNSDSNHMPMDVDLNVDYGGNGSNDDGQGFGFANLYKSPLDPSAQNDLGLSEVPSRALFPSSEADSVGHRGHFRLFPSGSSSRSEENTLLSGDNSQGRHHQPSLRSVSLMEVPSDEWQAYAADIRGRHRMVSEMRQILSTWRRSESLRDEDHMLFDPYSNGVADLHDRHRDMRLDVDNMSYEELLALEERIGDVKTGLSEEVILKSMKQRKHMPFLAIFTPNLEPCCICQEEYNGGDEIGTLDCGHEYHTCCIKEWLAQKNICPICKKTGLST